MPFSEELVGAAASDHNWKIIWTAMSVVPVSLAVTLLPRDREVYWWCAVLAVGISVLTTLGFLWARRRQHAGSDVPSSLVVTALSAMLVAAGFSVYGGSGPIGIYTPLMMIVLVLFAMYGDLKVLIYGIVATLLALGGATWATGTDLVYTVTLVVEYAICWVAAAVMVFLLMGRLQTERETSVSLARTAEALADLTKAAVRITDLEAVFDRCLPLIPPVVHCERVAVVALGSDQSPKVLAVFPNDPAVPHTDLVSRIDLDDLTGSLASGVTRAGESMLCIPGGLLESGAVAFVLDGTSAVDGPSASDATVASVAGVVSNMIERISFVTHLEELTRTDPLTGVANRLGLVERVTHDLARAGRDERPVSVVMIDLDHFKAYNDTWGHLAGDQALKAVASVLHSRARSADFVARFGGEEFCVCLPDTDESGALKLVEDQRSQVQQIAARSRLTFSAGIACWDGTESAEDLLARADRALYAAKMAGRDRSELASALSGGSATGNGEPSVS